MIDDPAVLLQFALPLPYLVELEVNDLKFLASTEVQPNEVDHGGTAPAPWCLPGETENKLTAFKQNKSPGIAAGAFALRCCLPAFNVSMAILQQTAPGEWDPTQFKLQADGTFRISIRGMAAMAGVDDGSLSRSLKSAAAENALPCARSLVAQGFDPAAVSTWGETGGIPEEAAPFILEHYGITATSPSAQARAVLLAFSRVGINAYLKERLGVSQVRDTQPVLSSEQQALEWFMGWSQRYGIKLDDRDMLQLKNHAMSLALPPAGQGQSVYNDIPISRAVYEQFRVQLPLTQLSKIGRLIKAMFRNEFREEPPSHDQYVDGANRSVAHYDRAWLVDALRRLHDEDPSLFCRSK